LLERNERVSIVLMTRPERRNALSVAMREALITALEAAMGDATTRAIVLTGAGGHFCAGGDLEDFELADVEAGRHRMARAHVLPRLIAAGPKPVVAAVEGSAFGAGLSLAMMCDFVIASSDARFCASFVKTGLMPDYGLVWALQRRVGHTRASEILMQAVELSGDRAQAIGLINEACVKGSVFDTALRMAGGLATRAPLAIAAIKQTQAVAAGLESVFAQEIELQARLFKSVDFEEAISAFRAKRPPEFKGA
jgi:enoyl-CoA hydratase/carnithine racemase